MPAAVAKSAIVAVAAAVAAAIAVYESPQAKQFAEDVRRKIAFALHSLGEEINYGSQRQPGFNRPEDAEGFLQSRAGANRGVEADEDSKRRQREELMYWNAVHLVKLEKERKLAGDRPAKPSRGSSFDDFLQEDHTAEKGTYVYKTGADIGGKAEEGLRQRGIRGLDRTSFYVNPFADENGTDVAEQRALDSSLMSPGESERDEVMSDVHSAPKSSRESRQSTVTIAEKAVDTSEAAPHPPVAHVEEPMVADNSNNAMMTVIERDDNAYASIHAWADNANSSFYSPLPVTPRSASPRNGFRSGSSAFSDPDVSSPGKGHATPTDSASVADSGEDVWAPHSGATSDADVMSIDGDGIATPGSWTEVGSEVSENDIGLQH